MQILLALAFVVAGADGPRECANPPSRVSSDAYWGYIDACGCSKLERPSRASNDYDRYLKACSSWRERNPTAVVAKPAPSPSPTPAAAECANPPSRVSSDYWSYLDACGCAVVEPPPTASDDFPRYQKACSQWREANPVIVAPARPKQEKKETPPPSGR